MGLREFVELFDKNEVKNLFNALSSCIEYVRIDLHVFNIGAHVACLYSNDPELLSQAEGYPVDVDLETQGFYRCNDAGTLPGECADFIFHKCND